MGNSLIENSRLRRFRTKKRKVKEDLEKYVRKQNKLYTELWNKKREIPLLPLEKPYQKGFIRFFVLREDIAKTKDADFFSQILNKINTNTFSDNRKFLKKKRKRGKRIYIPRVQNLATFSEYQFEKTNSPLFTDEEKSFFAKREEYCPMCKSFITYYEFREPWRFKLQVKPNIITHYKPLDINLEKELEEVSQFLDQHKIRGIILKKINVRTSTWKATLKKIEKEKYKHNSLKNNNLHKMKLSAKELAEMYSEEI